MEIHIPTRRLHGGLSFPKQLGNRPWSILVLVGYRWPSTRMAVVDQGAREPGSPSVEGAAGILPARFSTVLYEYYLNA